MSSCYQSVETAKHRSVSTGGFRPFIQCFCVSIHDTLQHAVGKVEYATFRLLDVLTPSSDCRQESVEKMERRILGVSYFVLDLHNGILCCGFLCARLISVCLFSGYHAEGYHAPPIPYDYHAEGYHARTDIFKLTGYHVCSVTTPELPRFIQVFTPAGSFYIFFFSSADTSVLHNNNHNFSTETGAHRTDPHNTLACCVGPCGVRHAYIWPYMLTRVAGNVSY